MCRLIQVHYKCGHSRKKLLQPCETARKLGPVPSKRAPDFCLNGLRTNVAEYSAHSCGRGHNGYTCIEIQAINALEKRYQHMLEVLRQMDERIRSVETVWVSGARPEYDLEFSNMSITEVTHPDSTVRCALDKVIPWGLQSWSHELASARQALKNVFEDSVATIRSESEGRTIGFDRHVDVDMNSQYPCGSSTSKEEEEKEGDTVDLETDNTVTQLITLNSMWDLRTEALQEIFESVEEAAILGGLDAVGWKLPPRERWEFHIKTTLENRQIPPRGLKHLLAAYVTEPSPFSQASKMPAFDPLDTAEDSDMWL